MAAPTPATASPATGPLTGVRVLDCSTVIAGPMCAQLLGDFGADVIKIEHPRGGDNLRTHGLTKDGIGLWWTTVARNKRTVGLYLGDPEGAEVFRTLAASADVIVENFRPGTLEKWGLGPDLLRELNPRLVIVRVTGFGQSGPYSARPGFGTLAEAMSGFAAITGEAGGPPTLPPFGLADSIAAISGAFAALLGLYHRDAGEQSPHRGSGSGQVVDLAILEPLVTVLGGQPTWYAATGYVQQREGNRSSNNAPRNTYRTADGDWVAVSSSTTSIAARIMNLVGRPDLAEQDWFHSAEQRALHADEIDGAVASWIAARPREEVLTEFARAEAAVAPVYDIGGLMADEHAIARDMFAAVEHPVLGTLRQQNMLFRMSETPGSIRWAGRSLGEDTDEVLAEAGLGPDRIDDLRKRGILG